MSEIFSVDSRLPAYMIFPRFLLETDLNETARMVYMVILDRCRLSQQNGSWHNENGDVYAIFPTDKLAKMIHKSRATVKTALASLEQAGLIRREQTEPGRANRLYVRIPADEGSKEPESENPTLVNPTQANPEGRKTSLPRAEYCPAPGQNVSHPPAGELAPNKNYNNKNNGIKNNQGEMRKSAYGRYGNVFLSEEELRELQDTVPDYRDYIERISEYQESAGKQYQNYAAAIHSWARRDTPKKPVYDRKAYYHFNEGDSL